MEYKHALELPEVQCSSCAIIGPNYPGQDSSKHLGTIWKKNSAVESNPKLMILIPSMKIYRVSQRSALDCEAGRCRGRLV
jgi:hypothetical protein